MKRLGDMYHFVGIGGAGMSAIAQILLSRGVGVSGSDLVASAATRRLAKLGAVIEIGHRSENVPDRADAVVVSSAIPRNNVEVVRAGELGIPVWERMELLSRIMDTGRGIGVAGTHGKTTTASMIALIADSAGLDPTVLVGGELNDIGGNARQGTGDYIVAEVDESDGTFVRLSPFAAVVTNVEDDHLEHYGDVDRIQAAFSTFVRRVRPDGFSVLSADDPFLARMAAELDGRVVTFGFGPADIHIHSVRSERLRTVYRVTYGNRMIDGELAVPGRHNAANAAAALAVAHGLGLDLAAAAGALAAFRGVGRRFETIANTGVWIVDDYAHHPTEVQATLAAARSAWPGRIVVVFQPHRYSRTRNLATRFGEAFADADVLFVTDVYPAGETPEPGVDGRLVADAATARRDGPTHYVGDLDSALSELRDTIRPGDLILTVGAGNVRSVGVRLARELGLEAEEVSR